tara:strand:+ start:286 stop:516 length:231 start_codon:yes stop_codon:yes gene_type:complete
MIYSILENSINSALELEENFDENGNIKWDYIQADAYADVRSFFKDEETFNEFFDDIVDGILGEMDEAAFQYEMTLH